MTEQQSDPTPDCRLGRSRRLRGADAFREAFARGARVQGRFLVLWTRRGEGASLRLGVVAAKKTFRRAVDRSRAKRLLREAFRLNRWRLAGDVDVILVARSAILKVGRRAVEQDLLAAAAKAGIFTPAEHD